MKSLFLPIDCIAVSKTVPAAAPTEPALAKFVIGLFCEANLGPAILLAIILDCSIKFSLTEVLILFSVPFNRAGFNPSTLYCILKVGLFLSLPPMTSIGALNVVLTLPLLPWVGTSIVAVLDASI